MDSKAKILDGLFSEFNNVSLTKIEFLRNQGGTIKQIILEDKFGCKAHVDQFGKVTWIDVETFDLMVDEFLRIKSLTDNQEIHGLCDRAISGIKQRFPVIDQRDEAIKKLQSVESGILKIIEDIRGR